MIQLFVLVLVALMATSLLTYVSPLRMNVKVFYASPQTGLHAVKGEMPVETAREMAARLVKESYEKAERLWKEPHTQEALKDAREQLLKQAHTAADTISSTVKDPENQEKMKEFAGTVANTFKEVLQKGDEEMRKRIEAGKKM